MGGGGVYFFIHIDFVLMRFEQEGEDRCCIPILIA